jgi:hypothetical protein
LRSIDFNPEPNLAAAEVSDMAYILLNANNLRSLTLGAWALPSMLLIATHSASSSLQFLRISVKADILPDAQHIGQLKRLESLNVKFTIADWSKVRVFWDLPCLNSLEWRRSRGVKDSHTYASRCKEDLNFLTQCRFAALIYLKLYFVRGDSPASVDVAAFRKLVEKKQLVRIDTLLLPEQAKVLLPHTPALTVALYNSPIIPDMAGCFHVRTEVFTVCLTEGNLDGWLQFLDAMCTLVRTDDPKLRRIQVFCDLTYLPMFTWGFGDPSMLNVSPEAAQFVGRMLGFAVRLKPRGIDLLDERGTRCDVTEA